jgi:hypothetical protein
MQTIARPEPAPTHSKRSKTPTKEPAAAGTRE